MPPLVTALACDGPCNGQYIDTATAYAHGYEASFWPTGEQVWMQPLIRAIFHG